MKTEKNIDEKGYIYLEILVGLIVLTVGIYLCIELNNDVVRREAENENYLKAIQIGSDSMEELIADFKENPELIPKYLEGELSERIEQRFERKISLEKDSRKNLLNIKMVIRWKERDEMRDYLLVSSILDATNR